MSAQTQNTGQKGPVPLSNEREVVDPISHLPITIHDATKVELEQIPPPLSTQEEIKMRRRRGADTQRDSNQRHIDMENVLHETMHESWWEDPIGNQRRARVQTAVVAAIAACVGSLGTLIASKILSSILRALFGFRGVGWFGLIVLPVACCILGLGVGFAALSVGLFQHEPEKPPPAPAKRILNKHDAAPETARWLNTFLHSVWPIINPALFTPVADMLEDSMQATLPKLVKGVRVADLGHGTESIRILGIRLLDAGAAAQDVGDLKAEEGEFINMEVAIAYRGKTTTTQGLRGRAANAHLLLEFYTSGGLMIPVWVELTGLLATARMRIQLTPNPPFISMATLSLLGLPKVTMKCTPLAKGFLNVMDVPGLSNFVQQSINLAVSEFVAPKSMALDLKAMLMGLPKMDTESAGVVVVTIRHASGFKGGSAANPFKPEDTKKGDVYVTVCWSKWGKPLWSTRIIASGDPVWEETTAVLVGPAELNAQESLKIQLWDADRYSADDSIGNISVPLRGLMESKQTLNHMSVREDPLVAEDGKTRLPGTITWECGFFAKTTLDQHLAHKQQDPDEFRKKVEAEAESKLREAKILETETGDDEIQQQKNEDLKEKTDEVIASSKPTSEWPSGILSIRIEQINGLEIQHIRESGVPEDAEAVEGEDLPSAYCTIIINHQRVYKTRTKMKSNDPFFDAGTEKFIRNWRTTDLIISVRDRRFHETDPVVGVVILPIQDILKRTSQWSDTMPLVGGIGYGRMKVSLLFRSVQLQLPKRLLGWDVGTLEIEPSANASVNTPSELNACRLVFRTGFGKGKMYADRANGGWAQSHKEPIRLAVLHRYASCLLIQFKKRVAGPDIAPAFCTLWLKDIPDDTPVELALPIRENANRSLARSEKNATQDIGNQIGTLYVRVQFHSGLSGYHKRYASRDKGLEDVIQVLDYAEEAEAVDREADESKYDDPSLLDSPSSSDSDDEDDGMGGAKKKKRSSVKHNPFPAETKGAFAGFRKHQSDLHRRHRGLLQWSGARNLAWIGKGLEHRAGKATSAIRGLSKHSGREIPLEKEIN